MALVGLELTEICVPLPLFVKDDFFFIFAIPMLLRLTLKSRFSGPYLLGAGIMNVHLCDKSKRIHGKACELDLKKKRKKEKWHFRGSGEMAL